MLSSQLAERIDQPGDRDAAPHDATHRLNVATRFGLIEIDAANVITLSRPLHGFPGVTRFALLDIPGAGEGHFKLFQALDDPATGFIVLPIGKQSGAIAPDDLTQACAACGLDPEEVVVLLLVTFRKGDDGQSRMTANLRAPVLLDVTSRSARQHIFVNADYPVRLPLEAAG